MATLGSLVISLEANIAKFESAMTKAEYAAKKASDNIVGALKGVGVALGAMFSLSAMDKTFNSITSMESALLKMAGRLNTNVETLSSFSIMARKTGMDTDSFYMALTRLDKGLSAAAQGAETTTGKFDEEGEEILKTSKTYDELGIKAQELIKLPLEQRMIALAEAFQKNIAPGDRVRVAMELAGRGGAGLVNAFKEGPAAMQKWIDRATELGLITTDMAKRGAEAKTAAGDLSLAWSNFARELVDAVAPAITSTLNLLVDLAVQARQTAKIRADITAGVHTGDFGDTEGGVLGTGRQLPKGVTGSWTPDEVFKPPVKPLAAGKGGGGKGGGAGEDRMASIIDTLQKDLAKLTEGALAEIEGWATKAINDIEKVGKKGADTERALTLVAQVEAGKKKKATEDYENFVDKESGNTYKVIEAEARAWLEKYKGFANAEQNIAAIKARKIWEEDVKNYENRLTRQKSALDSLAGEMPLLSQQLALKHKILPLETELQRLALDRMIVQDKIGQAEADELRGLHALTVQAKKYSLEREQWKLQGAAGGVKIGAQDMKQQADTWAADQTAALMKSMPQQISTSMASFFVGALQGKQADFQAMGWSMAESVIQKMLEGVLTQIIPSLAQGVAGIFGSLAGGGGGDIFGSIVGGITSIFGLHDGTGPIYAHNGLKMDEYPAILQTGERVLNRKETRAFEKGGGGVTIIHHSSFNNYPTTSEMRRVNRRLMAAAEYEARRRG